MTIYSLDIFLFLFGTSLFHVQFRCFLTCIQVSQEAGQVVWCSVIHIVNEAEVDVFLELTCFFFDLADWQFDLWFLCLFSSQLEHLEVHGSCIVKAWLGEF